MTQMQMRKFVCALPIVLPLLAHAAAPLPAADAFAKPHQRVDIGGRHINLFCAGSGSTTVIFDGPANKFYAMFKEHDQQCLDAANKGMKPAGDMADSCIGDPVQYYGPVLGKQVKATMLTKSYWRTRVDEANAYETSDNQLRALRRPFGDLPLVVLTRGVSPYMDPSKPQSAVSKAMEDENEKIHKELAALSSKGKQRIVPGASHGIQGDKPAAVTQAVVEVLAQIK
jgi:hypothetical protein